MKPQVESMSMSAEDLDKSADEWVDTYNSVTKATARLEQAKAVSSKLHKGLLEEVERKRGELFQLEQARRGHVRPHPAPSVPASTQPTRL